MERLTWHRPKDGAVCARVPEGTSPYYIAGEHTSKVYERLAHYEDLEDQKRIVVLPCGIGERVYYCRFAKDGYGWVTECIVCGIHISDDMRRKNNTNENYLVVRIPPVMLSAHISMKELGKTLFTNKRDAEKEIKERAQNGKN